MAKKKNIYTHSIDLKKINIKNTRKEEFVKQLIALPYRGYEVENISDGRSIVITKPGGKAVFGQLKKEDFLVYIYKPEDQSLWQITHQQILEDLKNKLEEDATQTKVLISLFKRVLDGEDPEDLKYEVDLLKFNKGELPEVLLKVYKWIWGQEDVNYPNGEGRNMSWKAIEELKDQ